MPDLKPKIVYIASNGRSGSTILEMLLNVSPHLWTVGEFHVLPWEIRENVKPCGCGTPVHQCKFWGPIIAEHRETLVHGTIDRFRKSYNTDRAVRLRELLRLINGELRSRQGTMEQVGQYANDNRLVLEAVQRQATRCGRPDLTWLIDSSKSPYRLLWLSASGQFDLRVIHLVKDPRAFAYSCAKEFSGISRTYRVARATARWQVENRIFGAICSSYVLPHNLFRLQYEQLASCPDAVLDELARWLGIPAWPQEAKAFREENHGISGNPSRFEDGGIRLDKRWQRDLSWSLQGLAYRLGAGLVGQYGYDAAPTLLPTTILKRPRQPDTDTSLR